MFNNKSRLITKLQSTISQQQVIIDQLTAQIDLNKSNMATYESKISKLQSQLFAYSKEVLSELDEQIKLKQSKLSQIMSQISQKENEIHLTSLSFFNLEFNSQHYRGKIVENRLQQRDILSNDKYFSINEKWFVNGDMKSGTQLVYFLINICINSLNQMCDSLMQKVNVANYSTYRGKICRAWDNYDKNLSKFNVKLNDDYLNLKLAELELNLNVSIKLDEEKEELARQREILREQVKLEKELSQEREKLERELVKLRISKLNGEEVDDKIEALEDRLSDNDKILNNTRFGAVYVISNPSFGKDVVKIGLTRRVFNNCESRLSELNNASVPFLFNAHCILWSDDCFKLESDLHNRLNSHRVNKINTRKEFFKIPLQELEKIIKDEYDKNAIFNYDIIDDNFVASGYKLINNFRIGEGK